MTHTDTPTHARLPDVEASMGCVAAACTCGWTSAPTNRPQHLGRAFRSHAAAAAKDDTKAHQRSAPVTSPSQFSKGYAQAMTDLLDAADRGGVADLAQWLGNNCAAADRERAAALLDLLDDAKTADKK